MKRHQSHFDRRTVLRTAAGLSVIGLSGCLTGSGEVDNGTTPANDDSNGQGVLRRVAVEGTTLVVEIGSDADVEQVNLIQPNGELFGKREVASGVRRVSFEIGTAYDPGEYRVIAVEGEDTVAESALSIDPEIEIVEMGIGRNTPEKMWDGTESKISEEAFVTIKNRGSGPDAVTKLLFIGEVPYPSDEEGTNYAGNEAVSGIYDPESDSEVDEVVIDSEEQTTIFSSRSPFAFVLGAGTSCVNEEQTGEFELSVKTRVKGTWVSKSYTIQYSASEDADKCEMSINEV